MAEPFAVNPGVSRFTLQQIKPHLRPELDRRILAIAIQTAEQIGEDQETVIGETLSRFSEWITTAPTEADRQRLAQQSLAKIPPTLAELSAKERRRQVMIHQGIKFAASLKEMEAIDGGALAIVWNTRGCDGDDAPDHKSRNGCCYAIQGNWAAEKGLMTVGPHGYYGDISGIAQEHYCQCSATWVFNLRDLPEAMMTAKGKAELERVRAQITAMGKP